MKFYVAQYSQEYVMQEFAPSFSEVFGRLIDTWEQNVKIQEAIKILVDMVGVQKSVLRLAQMLHLSNVTTVTASMLWLDFKFKTSLIRSSSKTYLFDILYS